MGESQAEIARRAVAQAEEVMRRCVRATDLAVQAGLELAQRLEQREARCRELEEENLVLRRALECARARARELELLEVTASQ
jgi:hypothetical protein